jgi:hypothetical protein
MATSSGCNDSAAQLDEIEMLQSIYSRPDEFTIEDEVAFATLKDFTEGKSVNLPNHVEFTLHLSIDNDKKEMEFDIEINCRLPNGYPSSAPPKVSIHSDCLTRTEQDRFNQNLQAYISTEMPISEACLLSIVEWSRDNAPLYYTPALSQVLVDGNEETESTGGEEMEFCRMWLYMHHIYSKTKRRNILSLADELQLTGFCLPGKPGVVCIEGYSNQTKQFYNVLRRWNWKSITCKEREIIKEVHDVEAERKIKGFCELFFDTHGGQRSNHMDLGKFRDYLKMHNLEYMFKELFGIDR